MSQEHTCYDCGKPAEAECAATDCGRWMCSDHIAARRFAPSLGDPRAVEYDMPTLACQNQPQAYCERHKAMAQA